MVGRNVIQYLSEMLSQLVDGDGGGHYREFLLKVMTRNVARVFEPQAR